MVGIVDLGLDTSGVSRALEKAERYGDIDELSAVFEKGESGPRVDTEKRTGSLGVVAPGASWPWDVLVAAVAFELD